MENCNYAEKAANWWSTQIKNSTNDNLIKGLDSFEKNLAKSIKHANSIKGQVIICTYNHNCKFLEEIAEIAHLSEPIPKGYDMRIIMNNVYVYNSIGKLVASF